MMFRRCKPAHVSTDCLPLRSKTLCGDRGSRWPIAVVMPSILALTLLSTTASAIAAQQPPIDLNDPTAISSGQEQFNRTCAGYCHGRDGLQGKGPSLRNRSDLSDERIHDTIANGRRSAGKIMPAWKEQIPDEKIWQITAFIRSLRETAK